jgi:hypothetical protein
MVPDDMYYSGKDRVFLVEVLRHREDELPQDRIVASGVQRERHADRIRGGYTVLTWPTLDLGLKLQLGWE